MCVYRVGYNWGEKRINGYHAPFLFRQLSQFPPHLLIWGSSPVLTLRPQEAAGPGDRVNPLAGRARGERGPERP